MLIIIWVTCCVKKMTQKILRFTMKKHLRSIQTLGGPRISGELFLTVGNLELAKANLEELEKLC